MVEVKNITVHNFDGAVRSMRNPTLDWEKSDSWVDEDGEFVLGLEDEMLARRLMKKGSVEKKFLQHIMVSFTIKAPSYFFAELDAYQSNAANPISSSTLHTLSRSGLEEEMIQFSLKEEFKEAWESYLDMMQKIVEKYRQTKDIVYYTALKEMLVGGFYFTKNLVMNYEDLRFIYHQRKNNKLPEWREFCQKLEELPYSEFITE